MRQETISLHGGQAPDPTTGSRAVPIYQTTSYVFQNTEHAARLFSLEEPGNIYTRIMNPTTAVFEERVAMLENGVGALATASGQSAITMSIINIAGAGDEVVASSNLYGGTYNLFRHSLPRLGIKVHFADIRDHGAIESLINERTKLVYVETLGNPGMEVADLKAISSIAHSHGLPLFVDNTFATPYLCRPLEYGADVVVHSATKYIGGHGTSIGGVVVEGGNFDWSQGRHAAITEPDDSYHGLNYWKLFGNFEPAGGKSVAYITKLRVQWLRDLGAAASPFNAWMFLQGLETLHLRMERHSENAMKIASFLESHPGVNWVQYPGLSSHKDHDLAEKYFHRKMYGGMMGFGIKGGLEAGRKFINSLKLFSHVANVGDAKSLAIHPASTTHQQLTSEERASAGVTDDFIRLSIGIESFDDIREDLEQALASV